MTYGWANGMWRKAVKNGIALVCGIIISNLTDPTVPLYSVAWFKHIAISSATVFLLTELTYFKNWLAANGNGKSNNA